MHFGNIAIAILGLIFILAGLIMMLAFKRGNRSGQEVTATVIAIRKIGRPKAASHFITLEYPFEGEIYTTEVNADTISLPPKGSTMTIGVDPTWPERVYLRRGKAYLVFYVMGAAILGLAVLI